MYVFDAVRSTEMEPWRLGLWQGAQKVCGYVSFVRSVRYFCLRQINNLSTESVESNLVFAGFLVFLCLLKADAVDTLKVTRKVSFSFMLFLILT